VTRLIFAQRQNSSIEKLPLALVHSSSLLVFFPSARSAVIPLEDVVVESDSLSRILMFGPQASRTIAYGSVHSRADKTTFAVSRRNGVNFINFL
jgi:hypothetical protein